MNKDWKKKVLDKGSRAKVLRQEHFCCIQGMAKSRVSRSRVSKGTVLGKEVRYAVEQTLWALDHCKDFAFY